MEWKENCFLSEEGGRTAQEAARKPVCLCCVQKPATEPEAALRRLTFVYQTMLVHSSFQSPSHLAPLVNQNGVVHVNTYSSSAVSINMHTGSSRCWLGVACSLCLSL